MHVTNIRLDDPLWPFSTYQHNKSSADDQNSLSSVQKVGRFYVNLFSCVNVNPIALLTQPRAIGAPL